MFEISVSRSFEASHYLPHEEGAAHYKTLHGHSFVVTATVATAAVGEKGWVCDLGVLERALEEAVGVLDHTILNDINDLGHPTLENIAVWIGAHIKASVDVQCSKVEVARPTLHQRGAAIWPL